MLHRVKFNVLYQLLTALELLKEVKRLCKEFGFTAGMLKGALADGRKVKQQ